jgi:hypothetical protein
MEEISPSSLVVTRLPYSPTLLAGWVTSEALSFVGEKLPAPRVPDEIVHIAAALHELAVSTEAFTQVIPGHRDGVEAANDRARRYRQCLEGIFKVWENNESRSATV